MECACFYRVRRRSQSSRKVHESESQGVKLLMLQALAFPLLYSAKGSCTIPEIAFSNHMTPKVDPAVRSLELVLRISPCHESMLRAPCDA
jgi:hypothetical protein